MKTDYSENNLSPCIPIHSPSGCRVSFMPIGRRGDELSEFLPVNLVLANQIHSAKIARVENSGERPGEFDGLLTNVAHLPLGIMTADCVPVFLYAADIKEVAAVHAGWRGTVAKIAESAVKELVCAGAKADHIYAIFGPCICKDCYEVDEVVAERFREAGLSAALSTRIKRGEIVEGKYSLDLIEGNKIQLRRMGIKSENITVSGYCTSHSLLEGGGRFPSWRRDSGTELRICSMIELE